MQPIAHRPVRKSALLFVRSTEHVPRAREVVNMLLAAGRRDLPSTGGEVLGICVHEHLDEGLFAPSEDWLTTSVGVALRESVALAGIWSLCWFVLPRTVGPLGDERRRLILDTLDLDAAFDPKRSSKCRLLFAVWTPEEALQDVSGGLRGLQRLYPAWEIGRESFVDQPEGGVVSMVGPTTLDNAR